MTTVFLSYSTKDHHFAELATLKLADAGITLWRDKGQLRAGNEWRGSIERGIAESIAVLVALSQASTDSSYVTFEWAYALGKSKTIVPLKLEACKVHPRLEPIQYLDFSVPGALPFDLLVERIREIAVDATSQADLVASSVVSADLPQDPMIKSIIDYMSQRGYQYITYDRVRRRIDPLKTDKQLDEFVDSNPTVFQKAVLADSKPGLKKLVP